MHMGRLVVFEGLDAAGKGTQIDLLRSKFDCPVFKYPTRGFPLLNDYLEKKVEIGRKALFLLFLADIANEQEKIKAALHEHEYVFVDRYIFSTIAYELDSITYARAKKIVTDIGFLKPDRVILLDLDAKTAQLRKSKQKKLDRYEENAQYLEKVRSNFLKLYKDKFLSRWHRVDAGRGIDAVHKDILNIIRS